MKMEMRLLGVNVLDKQMNRLIDAVSPEAVGVALKKAIDETIVPEARRNVWAIFDTEGDFPSHIKTDIEPNLACPWQVVVRLIVDAPYAHIHEYGGTVTITERQRAYFWYRYYELKGKPAKRRGKWPDEPGKTQTRKTEPSKRQAVDEGPEKMWKCLALSNTYTIPARPYLRPAIDKMGGAAVERAKLYIDQLVQAAVR